MNRLKAAWNALTGKAFNPLYGSMTATINGGQVTWMADNLETYLTGGYSANDIVYSIGQITSEKIKVAPWNVYKVKDESSLKWMQALQTEDPGKHHRKIIDLRTKALELFTGDDKLNALLQWPNESETFSDLVAHSSISKMMTGNRYIQAVLLEGGANGGKPQELYLLPAQHVGIVNNKTYPIRVQAYVLGCHVPNIQLTKEEVMHDKYYNPLYDQTGTHLYGLSPLKAARMTLTNDNEGMSRSTASFQNGGPEWIIFTDDQRLSGDESLEQASALKKKLQELEGVYGAKKVASAGYKVGGLQMGLSPIDLNILNQQKWNLVKFCNIWNFPHTLLNPDHTTYNNLTEASKALVVRCCMPLLTSFRANFNRMLQTYWGYKGKNIYADFDQTVYPELQPNMTQLTDWIMKSWHLPLRMRYELQNLEVPDYITEEMLKKIYIPANMVELGTDNLNSELDDIDIEELLKPTNGNGNPVKN